MTSTIEQPTTREGPPPMLAGEKSRTQVMLVKLFVIVPLAALAVAVPFAWGWGLGWVDISARIIWVFEKLGWVHHVRWPKPERLARKLKTTTS